MNLLAYNRQADFAIPPEEQKRASEINRRIRKSYPRDPDFKRLIEEGKSPEQARKIVKAARRAETDSLNLPKGKAGRFKDLASRKQKIREEAFGKKGEESLQKTRQTLKDTKTKRAQINKHLRDLQSSDEKVRQKAIDALNKYSPSDFDEIENAYKEIANLRKSAKPSAEAGKKLVSNSKGDTVPSSNRVSPSKPTAPERALEDFNKRRQEFLGVQNSSSSNIPSSLNSSNTPPKQTTGKAATNSPPSPPRSAPPKNTASTGTSVAAQVANIKKRGLDLYSRTNSFVKNNPLAASLIVAGTGLAGKGIYDAIQSRQNTKQERDLSIDSKDASLYGEDDYRRYL